MRMLKSHSANAQAGSQSLRLTTSHAKLTSHYFCCKYSVLNIKKYSLK